MSQGSPTEEGSPVAATRDESFATMTDVPTIATTDPGASNGATGNGADPGTIADDRTDAVDPEATGAGDRDGEGDDGEGADGTAAAPAKSSRHQLISWLVVLLLATGCAIGLRAFVVQTFFVPSSSMFPTLQQGDRILVQKIGFSIQRGDILVFRRPPGDVWDTNDEDLVKRVIGLPGETISSRGNTVYIIGKALAEPYLPKGTVLGRAIPPTKIPAGDYYMMGDNRNNSEDSRYWGFLPRSYVVGKVFLIVWRHGHPWFHPL
jgi:signal peptidase I